MHLATNYLGKDGCEETFQGDFPEVTACPCGGAARIALVVTEEGGLGERSLEQRLANPKLICDLRRNTDKCWPHDCCAVAVYFCPECGDPSVEYNQA